MFCHVLKTHDWQLLGTVLLKKMCWKLQEKRGCTLIQFISLFLLSQDMDDTSEVKQPFKFLCKPSPDNVTGMSMSCHSWEHRARLEHAPLSFWDTALDLLATRCLRMWASASSYIT